MKKIAVGAVGVTAGAAVIAGAVAVVRKHPERAERFGRKVGRGVVKTIEVVQALVPKKPEDPREAYHRSLER